MLSFHNRLALIVVGALLATSGCGGNGAVPSSVGGNSAFSQRAFSDGSPVFPDDNTSILKKLKKDVVIGSTVDPKNGDTGPRALSQVPPPPSEVQPTLGLLKTGQLLVCNFADSAGTAGKGTTIEVLAPKARSKPTTFVQSSKFEGCDGDAVSSGYNVYAAGLTSKILEKYNDIAKPVKAYGPPIEDPLVSADAFCSLPYAPEDIYVGDAKTGSVVKFAAGLYGDKKELAVIEGFAVKGIGWGTLGPSGIEYNATLIARGYRCNDSLYIVDGVNNTIVAVSKASNLLPTGEIVVQPGGKTFKCKQKRFTCATLVYSGSPLNAPVALALLPNGNLIAANTKGGNKLVEISSSGKLLGTKLIDRSSAAHVFGLVASGTNDRNTVLFYTDTKDNSVHELEE
jgi:hypothetical protein